MLFVGTEVHPIKTEVWIAMPRGRIIGSILLEVKVTVANRYRLKLNELMEQLFEELQTGYFQNYNVTANTT